MQGLASDGGLFMPDIWPQLKLKKIESMQVSRIYSPFFNVHHSLNKRHIKVLEDAWQIRN